MMNTIKLTALGIARVLDAGHAFCCKRHKSLAESHSMKNKNNKPIVAKRHAIWASLIVCACLALGGASAFAQDTPTTVPDDTYGKGGTKTTETIKSDDSTGTVVTIRDGKNTVREYHTTEVYKITGKTKVEHHEYRNCQAQMTYSKSVHYDILGNETSFSDMKYKDGKEESGFQRETNENGKKKNQSYNKKTGKYEDVAFDAGPASNEISTPPRDTSTCDDTKPFELFLGFNYMRAPAESAKNLLGFNASLFYNVTPHVGIGGEFTGVFGSTTETVGTIPFDTSLHRFTYMAGPQFIVGKHYGVKYSVHALFGGVHDTTKTTIGTTSVSSSANAFAMAFGGGVDINLNNHLAVRPIQFDVVPMHFGGAWQSSYRISTAFLMRFGGKK
jgi:opacity protein-like surface antigen